MRKITQTIYNFDELEEETKKKLIEARKEEEAQFYCEWGLLEDMQEEAKRLLKKYFKGQAVFEKVYYSLSYSQGDGAMIIFNVPIEAINEIAPKEAKLNKKDLNIIKESYTDKVNIKHNNGFYYHERSFTIENDFYLYQADELSEDGQKKLEALLNWLKAYIITMNEELTEAGYKFIEAEPEEAYIIEQLQENEYFKNGEIY